jgi:hypothetical protein
MHCKECEYDLCLNCNPDVKNPVVKGKRRQNKSQEDSKDDEQV